MIKEIRSSGNQREGYQIIPQGHQLINFFKVVSVSGKGKSKKCFYLMIRYSDPPLLIF